MIVLDTTTRSLQILLGSAISTNQLPFTSNYVDVSGSAYTPTSQNGTTNSTTAVTLVSTPAASTQRQVKFISINNADTVSQTVTVRLNDNGTFRTLISFTLTVGDNLQYVDSSGWVVIDNQGNFKRLGQINNVIAGGSLTGTYPNPTIASGAILSGMMALGSVTSGVIATNAVGSGDIATGSVLSGTIASGILQPVQFGYIGGMITSYTSGSAAGTSGSVNITRGMCSDTSGILLMTLASGLTKTIASGTTWQSGTSKAGLDAVYPVASLQSGWLHLYAISDGNVADAILHNSASGLPPVLPSGMIYSRRIASLRTDGSGNVVPYVQQNDTVLFTQTRLEKNSLDILSGTTNSYTMTTPPGVAVDWLGSIEYQNPTVNVALSVIGNGMDAVLNTAQAAFATRTQVTNTRVTVGWITIPLGTSGLLRVITGIQSGQVTINTFGYKDYRGKDL